MAQESFWSGWRERLAALRNVPPVLGIVWQSGPAVVAGGLIFRLFASLLPMALLWVTKLIIDGIVRVASTHQPVQPRFWWLVAAEFGLAVLTSYSHADHRLSRTRCWPTSTPVTSAFGS